MNDNRFDNFFVTKERGELVIIGYKKKIVGTLTIPEGINKISECAFTSLRNHDKGKINKIIFPHSLRRIPKLNFEFWEDLSEVVIPEGVISIAEGAFMGTGLKEVTLPSSIERIGKNAFEHCDNLKKVTINHLSSSILNSLLNEYNALYSPVVESFHNDNRLKFNLYFGSSCPIELTNYYLFYDRNDKKSKYSIHGSGFILYGDCIIGYIGNEANLLLPECAKEIGFSAFKNNIHIEKVIFNEKIRRIGHSAFEGCSKLQVVELNNSLEFIGNYAFSGTKIKSIDIPCKVKYVGEYPFSNCSQLETIKIFLKMCTYNTCGFEKWSINWKSGYYNQIKYDYDF